MKLWKKVLIGIGAVLVVLAIAGAVVFAQLRARFAGPEISEVTAADSATVTTTAGTLRGGESDGVFIFKGVRYATAPRRFEPAQPVEPWEGVVDATEYGPTSPQGAILGMGASGNGDGTSNDCQTVNIWTPGLDDEARPIMVWLHGGGFSTGSGNDAQYDGEALARSGNVVVVAVNHRLNLYGHLDLSAYGNQYRYSGNVGVMDIQMALEWLRDNAASFGGDPDNITVFGQSGGGAKVIALASSPYAADLISKGIVQSGATETMGASFATAEQSARLTEHLLENLGISPDNVEALQTVSDADLQAAAATALQQTADEFQIPAPLTDGYQMEWGPVVDGDYLPTQPVLEDGFAASAHDIPLMIGSNLNEWTSFAGGGPEATEAVTSAFVAAYPNESPSEASQVDMLLRLPLLKIMAHKADQGGAPVYAYVFTYDDDMGGAYHGAEIPFVFAHATSPQPLATQMWQAWVSFARDGVPSADGLPTWEPYTRDGGATMILDTQPELVYGHDVELISTVAPDYAW